MPLNYSYLGFFKCRYYSQCIVDLVFISILLFVVPINNFLKGCFCLGAFSFEPFLFLCLWEVGIDV